MGTRMDLPTTNGTPQSRSMGETDQVSEETYQQRTRQTTSRSRRTGNNDSAGGSNPEFQTDNPSQQRPTRPGSAITSPNPTPRGEADGEHKHTTTSATDKLIAQILIPKSQITGGRILEEMGKGIHNKLKRLTKMAKDRKGPKGGTNSPNGGRSQAPRRVEIGQNNGGTRRRHTRKNGGSMDRTRKKGNIQKRRNKNSTAGIRRRRNRRRDKDRRDE